MKTAAPVQQFGFAFFASRPVLLVLFHFSWFHFWLHLLLALSRVAAPGSLQQ